MYNLRYHVASLVAVFLALTVGLVLGTVVAERGTLDDQSTTLVEDLQKQFDAIQMDNKALREGLERDRAFATDVVPALTAGALEGHTVAVLVNSGRSSGLEAAVTAIEEAGGTPVVFTFESAGLGLSERTPEGLTALLGEGASGTPDALGGLAAARMAAEWLLEGERPVTDLLADAGELTVRGESTTSTVDACVLMTSFSGEPDRAALAMAEAFDDAGVVVVGAEATSQGTGVAAEAVDRGFSAVDDIDAPQGAFSLVWLLAERASGYYGVAPGVDGVYPAPAARVAD
ncbi:MAG: copper transporter [Coriobacteriia bacterium]